MRALSFLGALAVCLALAACKTATQSGSLHIDPTLESLVPSDTVFIAGANVDAVRDTPVYQKLLSRAPLPQLDEFTRKTGLDPRKDLSEVLSCSNGKQGLLMARGKYRVSDLETRLQAQGAPRIEYKKYRLFGTEQAAIFFLNPIIAVAGPSPILRSIIDQGGHSGGLPPALRDLIRTIPANHQIFAALTGGLQGLNITVPENSNLANIMNALKSIDNATLGMDLRNGFSLIAEVTCTTERDAKFVHDMVKAMVGLGRLNTPDAHPELLKLYDAIHVDQQQTHTKVTAEIAPDLVDRFLDLWLKR